MIKTTYEENLERKNCPYRTDMGNCLSGGGFCLSVQTDKCRKHIEEALEKVERLEKENKKLKEKQTPKRPKKVTLDMQDFTTYFECPTCHTHEKCKASYCRWCGQKLDWSD